MEAQVHVRPVDQLKNLMDQAKLEEERKAGETSVDHWIKATALARIVHGESHWCYALCHVKTGQCYFELLGLPDQSLQHSLEGKQILECLSSHLKNEPSALHALALANCVAGLVLTHTGQIVDAEKCLLKAEKVYHRYIQSNPPDVRLDMNISSSFGRLCIKQGNFAMAETSFKKALGICQTLQYGTDHYEELTLMKEIADAKLNQKKFEEAITCLTEADKIVTKYYGDMSEDKAELLIKFGKIYVALSSAEQDTSDEYASKGEATFWNAHNILLLAKGPLYGRTLLVQDELVKLLILQSRHEEAIKILKELITNKSAVYGEGSIEVSRTRRTLGSMYLHLGDIDKASKQLTQVREVFNAVLGATHRDTVQVSTTLVALTGSVEGKEARAKRSPIRPAFK